MFEELKRYEEKVHRCIEGISHTLRSHAQIHADHAQRLARLEENGAQTVVNASQAMVDQNTSQLHKLMQFVGDTVYPGFEDVSSGLREVRDSLGIFVKELFERDDILDVSVNAVAARIDEVAKMMQISGSADDLVGTSQARQVEGLVDQEDTQTTNTAPVSKVPTADPKVATQLEVGSTSTSSVPTTDPVSVATNRICDQTIDSELKVSGTVTLTTDPDHAVSDKDNIGNLVSIAGSTDRARMQLEKDIKEEMVSISAVISSQIPSGTDDICALVDKSSSTMDKYLRCIVKRLAEWKKNYAGTDSTVFDEGLQLARAAIDWSLKLELACQTALGIKAICGLPLFTEALDMPVEKYFEEFESWFAHPSIRYAGYQLMSRYLDPGLQIDMVELGYNYQAAKDYLVSRFKKVPNCPVPVFATDPELISTPLSSNDPRSFQDWYDPALVKPCPLTGHGYHEAGTCLDF